MIKDKLVGIMFAILTSIIVASQNPMIIKTKYLVTTEYALILYFFLLLALKRNISIHFRRLGTSALIVALLVIYYLLMAIVIDKVFLTGFYLRYILMSFMMLVTGYISGDSITDDTLRISFSLYIIIALINGFTAYYSYIGSIDYWYNKTNYLYGSKNSLGILIGLAIICLGYFNKKYLLYIITLLTGLFFMIMLRSRAAFFSLICCFLLILFIEKEKNKLRKNPVLALAIGIIILAIPPTRNLVLRSFGLLGGEPLSIDEFSSFRISGIKEAISMYGENWLFGVGRFYIDFMPLSLAIEAGIIGLILVIFYIFSIIGNIVIFSRRLSNKVDIKMLRLVVMSGIYLSIISLFEGLLPFGPCNVTFLFWICLGLVFSKG